MTTATQIKYKKKRGLSSLINQPSAITSKCCLTQFKQIIEKSPPYESLTVIRELNKMIASGTTFSVAADGFQTVSTSQPESEFLRLNKSQVLCTLQQALLQKHLFSHDQSSLKDFAFEIDEREAIMSEATDNSSASIRDEAVKDVTQKWFGEILEKRGKNADFYGKNRNL